MPGRRSVPIPAGGDQNYRLVGRLGAGWTPAQAQAELRAASTDLQADLREPRDEARLDVQSYRDSVAAGTGGLVWPLTAAVGAILLLVCANAAGLQVARTVGRRRELALRAALGGRRGRLLRQLLTESVLLATAGGAVGALAAAAGVSGLVALRPRLAIWDITVDAPVLFGAVAIAVVTGVLFGLLPGALAVRSEPADTLRGDQSRSVTTAHASWMRRSLVVAQVALCTMLLVTAGVFLRTFAGLSTSDLGFDPANVLTARASLEGPAYGSRDAVAALYRRTLTELAQLPGVEAAAVANNLPVERGLQMLLLRRPDNLMEPAGADWRYVAGDYLDVLRIPLVAGRAFSAADHRAAAPPVALVNEMFASRFGGRAVLGTRLQMTAVEVDDQVREVVGIVGDVRTRGVTATRPTVFVPVEQVPDDLLAGAHGFFQVNWVLRTRAGRDRSGPVCRAGDRRGRSAASNHRVSHDGRGGRRRDRRDALPHVPAGSVRHRGPDAGGRGSVRASSPTRWRSGRRRSAFAWRWALRADGSRPASRSRGSCSRRPEACWEQAPRHSSQWRCGA